MSNEIQRKVDQSAQAVRLQGAKSSPAEPRKVTREESLAFRKLIDADGKLGEDGVEGVFEDARARTEEPHSPFAGYASGKDESGDDPDALRKRFAEKGEEEDAPASNMFALYGQIARSVNIAPARAASPAAGSSMAAAIDRVELVERIAEVADALMVRVDGAEGGSELRMELKPELMPDTSLRIQRNAETREILVEFTTSDPKVNLFLQNSNASLRADLAARLGAEVTVAVRHDPAGRDAADRGDERGRGMDWDIWDREA